LTLLTFGCPTYYQPCAHETLRENFCIGFILTKLTFQQQISTRAPQPNLLEKCFTGKSISCPLLMFSRVKQNFTGEMMKN